MNVSLDGYVGGPNGEVDWVFPNVTPKQMEFMTEFSRETDTVLLGRTTYLEQAATWPKRTGELANLLNSHTKVVFSKTLEKLEWNNSRFATEDLIEEVTLLKQQPGKNIFVTGGATLAQSLIELDLIDEWNLFIHPIILGEGKPLFKEPLPSFQLKLVNSRTYDTGVVQLIYQKK